MSKDYFSLLNKSILKMFQDAFRVSIKHPFIAGFYLKSAIRQYRAARKRGIWERKGLHAPPFMIVSITSRCNLQCKGCYAGELHRTIGAEMNEDKLRHLFTEAGELGISIILIAGGEPLSRPEILRITRDFPRIIFPLFTNGLLINDQILTDLKKQPNVIPIISLEGYQSDTDFRRGQGVYQKVREVIDELNQRRIFFGVSLTMTRENFKVITSKEFIKKLINDGTKLFFFVEYVPVKPGTEDLTPSEEQRNIVLELMKQFRHAYPGLFIAFPGDEEEFGGCLSAGRGFVHVSSDGALEPCPFAPYSDTNLKNQTLKEALKSRLLKEIRQNHDLLTETKGGCALWENREWAQGLAKSTRENGKG